MKPTRFAPIPALRGPSSGARVFACGQPVGRVTNKQKQRLSEIAVRAAP